MNAIRRVVVAALLAVWCFPAVSLAKSEPTQPAPAAQMATRGTTPGTSQTGQPATSNAETEDLAAREKQAPELQDFKGGAAIVIGGGALLVILVLLVLLV
jgi:hypothetical protein